MTDNNQTSKQPIDKERLKMLAEKIKAEKMKKDGSEDSLEGKPAESSRPPLPPKPPVPPKPSIPQLSDDDDDETEGMAAEKTAIIDLASLSGSKADAKLIIVDGKDEGKGFDITREEVIVGRSLDNDFVVSDISVSRKHFKVVKQGDGYKVEDLGSGNGIRVNGKKSPSEVLFHGDVITAGARNIKFEYINEKLREKYSRKSDSKKDQIVVKQKSSPIAWVTILLVLGLAGGGYFLFTSQQQQMQKQFQETIKGLSSEEEMELKRLRIDRFIEDKKIVEAENVLLELLAKKQNSPELNEKKAIIDKEKNNAQKFEMGKKFMTEKNNAEGEKLFRQITEDSVFYEDMKSLVGKDKIYAWAVEDAEQLVKEKKEEQAISKLTNILKENPSHQKAQQLISKLTATIGQEKVQFIQKKVVEQKVAKEREIVKKKERLEILDAKKVGKPVVKKIAPPVKKEPEPVVEAPKEEVPAELTKKDIEDALTLYTEKNFDGALEKLKKISEEAKNKAVKNGAEALLKEMEIFKKTYDNAAKEPDKEKRKRFLNKAIKYDSKISKGKLRKELEYMMDSEIAAPVEEPAKKEESDEGASEGGKTEEAKKLYMEGRALKDSNPEKAKEKFEEVLKTVPKDNKYYKKAKKSLRDM